MACTGLAPAGQVPDSGVRPKRPIMDVGATLRVARSDLTSADVAFLRCAALEFGRSTDRTVRCDEFRTSLSELATLTRRSRRHVTSVRAKLISMGILVETHPGSESMRIPPTFTISEEALERPAVPKGQSGRGGKRSAPGSMDLFARVAGETAALRPVNCLLPLESDLEEDHDRSKTGVSAVASTPPRVASSSTPPMPPPTKALRGPDSDVDPTSEPEPLDDYASCLDAWVENLSAPTAHLSQGQSVQVKTSSATPPVQIRTHPPVPAAPRPVAQEGAKGAAAVTETGQGATATRTAAQDGAQVLLFGPEPTTPADPSPKPPKKPTKPKPNRSARTKVSYYREYRARFERGVERATGKPFVAPEIRGCDHDVVRLLQRYALDNAGHKLTGDDVLEWIEDSALRWASQAFSSVAPYTRWIAWIHDGCKVPDTKRSPNATHPKAQEAIALFDRIWSARNGGRARAHDANEQYHAASCMRSADEMAPKVRLAGIDIFRQVVGDYLRDGDRYLVDNAHPLRLLASRFSSYPVRQPEPIEVIPETPREQPVLPTYNLVEALKGLGGKIC